MVRLASVTTLRDAGDVVHSFVRYQHAIGFDHVFLFFDDPVDPAYDELAGMPGVSCFRTGPALLAEQQATSYWNKAGQHYDKEVMARQLLNAAIAVNRAHVMGFDWLFHLDIDELLYLPGHDARSYFSELHASPYEQVVFLNHEAVPETEEVESYFREVSLFKRNPWTFDADGEWTTSFWVKRGWYFNGYNTGKAAVRLSIDPIVDGVHRFRPHDYQDPKTLYPTEPCVLHYQTCGLRRFVQKYRTLGRFRDNYWGTVPMAPFHLQSRDVILDGGQADIEDFYRTHVMLRGLSLEDEIARGRLRRYQLPPHLFE